MALTDADLSLPEQPADQPADQPSDENIWLEDIYGDKQLDWVRTQNARTEELLVDADYVGLEAKVLQVLDSTDRIPMVTKRGDWYYNFWTDQSNPRGLWRRTRWDSYTTASPEWEVLLDLDALAASEETPWVWHGATMLRPAEGEPYSKALVSLSPDGGDATRVREYDVLHRTFVDPAQGGFDLPVAKGGQSWLDADTLLIATTGGGSPVTTSSYPRTGVVLKRGQSLAEAELFFDVPEHHLMAALGHDATPGFERTFAVDVIDFYNQTQYLRSGSDWVAIDVPTDVNVSVHRQWLILRPQGDWEVAGTTHTAGSLLAIELDAFQAGSRELTTLFTPDAATSLQSWSWTRDYLLLNLLQDVSAKILVLDPADAWSSRELDACPPLHEVSATAVDDEDAEAPNDFWLVATGFTTPTALTRGTLSASGQGDAHAVVKSAPSFFDDDAFRVEQFFATSDDGTRVPYFQVSARDLVLDGNNPTLLSGYGGFEISRTPAYSGTVGRVWLERTAEIASIERHGVYVVANIRGGGEYGPGWHRAALREKRHRAYEDFAAVAGDLTARGVTTRSHLGCAGGSNGGLLVGNMLTQYPELFGAISCGVPLLDMRRYTKLSAGFSWIAEYGDPDSAEHWEFIKTFSPYHLLRSGVKYPDTFIWTATSDDRVGPVQARKMAARMESMGIDNVWFHEALEGGHSGASDNKQAAALHTRSHHFLWRALTGSLQINQPE